MSYDYFYSFDNDFGAGMVVFWLIYMLAMLALSVALYVLRSLGLYTIAKRRGINHPWLSWIPVVDYYLLGCISDQYQYVVKGKNKSKRKVLLVLSIVLAVVYVAFFACFAGVFVNMITGMANHVSEDMLVAGVIGPLMGILGLCIPMMGVAIALVVLRYIAMYDLYTSCSPQNNVLFLVLSIFFNVTEPFFIFFNRKKDDGMPPRRPEPQAYIPPQPRPDQEPWEN